MMIEVILDITTCLLVCTGRFIMFSVITNIYNKKTKGPTLMELFTATGKLTIFLTTTDVRRVHHVTRHTSIRYSSSCHTRVNMGASVFFTAVMIRALGQWGHMSMLGRILCTKCTLHSNHRLTVWYSNTQNVFSPGAAIFSLHTLASPSGRNVNYDKRKTYWEKKNFSCSFYLYRFRKYVSYGFPIINFCNPGVHYENPRIFKDVTVNSSASKNQ
jgi:hypothetical protein